ncbi:MAG TPA: hypothetical protein VGF77_07275 [Allosphingosinicella sp.]
MGIATKEAAAAEARAIFLNMVELLLAAAGIIFAGRFRMTALSHDSLEPILNASVSRRSGKTAVL